MPRYSKARLPDGWGIADREDGHWLQRREADGTWRDFAGPYHQRGSAYSKWRRWESRRIIAARTAVSRGAVCAHEWDRIDGHCVICFATTEAIREKLERQRSEGVQ